MSSRAHVLLSAAFACAFLVPFVCWAGAGGGPSPYVRDVFDDMSQTGSWWTVNGNVTEDDNGLAVSAASGASLISTVPVPDGSSQYEIDLQTGLSGADNPGGAYVLYLEATPNALLNLTGASSGSFYAFAIQTSTGQNGCQAQATLFKTVNGTVTQVAGTSFPCQSFYTAVTGTDGSLRLETAVNNTWYEPLVWSDTSGPLTGAAGVGAAGPGDGTSVHLRYVNLCPMDRVAPSVIPAGSVQTYVRPTEVDVRTAGSVDDSNGVGLYEYQWYRDGQFIGATFNPEYSDLTVAAGSTHTYGVNAIDFDGNASATTSFTVSTPAIAAVDPREIGVRSSGSYWGGMGEQIDVRSGNLNFSYPLLTPVSRGLSIALALTYNSQNWRLDNNGNAWNLGVDTGLGYGWQLEFGSITPYYSSTWDVAFYEFRDATGAVYRLDQN
jgi:hypothetical protein